MTRRTARALVYVGTASVVLALSKIHAAWIAEPAYSFTGTFRFAWALTYIVLLGFAAYGMGLPDVPRSARQGLVSSMAAAAAGATAMSLVQLVVGDALLPRFVVFGSAILLVPWYLACVGVANDGAMSPARARVLVVSGTASLPALRHDLSRSAERPARIAAVVEPEAVAPAGDGAQPLVKRAHRERASVLVLDREAQSEPHVVAQAATLHREGLRIRTMSLFYEEWLGKLPLAELERVSLLFDIADLHRRPYVRAKRLIDIVMALAGAIVLLVVMPVVLVGNRFGNRGKLFYSQPRVGRGGTEFDILKFRTMRAVEAGAQPTGWTQSDDPRVTRFGRVLRVSHLDELPQVLNILRGELSVVGPRPEQPHYVAELSEKLPFYDVRHLARPGLTGWAQVKYGYAGDESDALEKLQYEFFYLRHQSLALDLRIIVRTLRHILADGGGR